MGFANRTSSIKGEGNYHSEISGEYWGEMVTGWFVSDSVTSALLPLWTDMAYPPLNERR